MNRISADVKSGMWRCVAFRSTVLFAEVSDMSSNQKFEFTLSGVDLTTKQRRAISEAICHAVTGVLLKEEEDVESDGGKKRPLLKTPPYKIVRKVPGLDKLDSGGNFVVPEQIGKYLKPDFALRLEKNIPSKLTSVTTKTPAKLTAGATTKKPEKLTGRATTKTPAKK